MQGSVVKTERFFPPSSNANCLLAIAPGIDLPFPTNHRIRLTHGPLISPESITFATRIIPEGHNGYRHIACHYLKDAHNPHTPEQDDTSDADQLRFAW